MDKKTLNNEIILCRVAVRKAKVAVIRKIIKKIKILKSCKVEAMKEKKLKKSERLFKKIQIMKKIKLDEVTKFALRHTDLDPFVKGPKVNLIQNAMACLAQHDAVLKKINSIRERIPNWEKELPLLLDSLGSKKKKKKFENKKESSKPTSSDNKSNGESQKKDSISKPGKYVKNTQNLPKKKLKPSGKTPVENESESESDSENSMESDNSITENFSNGKVEKIDDPFFIGKKIIAPKLVLESAHCETNKNKIGEIRKPPLKRNTTSSLFHTKPFKSKTEGNKWKSQLPAAAREEENLHPSWAAKKVKLIKPFQGKKIKFDD